MSKLLISITAACQVLAKQCFIIKSENRFYLLFIIIYCFQNGRFSVLIVVGTKVVLYQSSEVKL